MPSHIFTRLGLWDDSIASNRAAMAAARAQHDVGEQLHAMDYLAYALIQKGRFDEAAELVRQARAMSDLPVATFKIGYAANAMAVRLAVERGDWRAAAELKPLAGSPAAAEAMVYWARALGRSRASPPAPADADIAALEARAARLRATGEAYWAVQADVMAMEAKAWRLAAQGQTEPAVLGLRAAANEEDQVEKLPVTPGPIVPAREQLGELLLASHRPTEALTEFNAALAQAPGRRGALLGAAQAARQIGPAPPSVEPRP
jgi:tetratricopeptide (TPR) repeat protein